MTAEIWSEGGGKKGCSGPGGRLMRGGSPEVSGRLAKGKERRLRGSDAAGAGGWGGGVERKCSHRPGPRMWGEDSGGHIKRGGRVASGLWLGPLSTDGFSYPGASGPSRSPGGPVSVGRGHPLRYSVVSVEEPLCARHRAGHRPLFSAGCPRKGNQSDG